MEKLLQSIKKFIPKMVFEALAPIYHYKLALVGALLYRFPSRNIQVVGVTGTKGKTTTIELVNAILQEAGQKTALAGTLRIKIGEKSQPNMFKMTMPGRFFVQQFLRKAVSAKCDWAILEMTSEGTKQFRHKFLDLDALVFTNLSPEHIESHGSYENYVNAKLKIAKALERSHKNNKTIIVNNDDKEAEKFLEIDVQKKIAYSLDRAKPFSTTDHNVSLTLDGKKVSVGIPGEFNIYNILGAVAFAKSQRISPDIVRKALEKFKGVRGRVEKVDEGQNFSVVVDYAHTPDSLLKLYQTFGDSKKICVLGGTGGGRDRWKRKEMGRIADEHCSRIILTNEDPYDEDPRQIVGNISEGIRKAPQMVIMDRRQAIMRAFESAKKGDVVLITGKGTDPYIMGPNGTRLPWDDAQVAREELKRLATKNFKR
ncbi:MAG: UDP-N-acetylmuramyl-tripeptide synthetase [bacterium]|nr:UDP-N-acetylmuramyl-tripeptide synthetase [bacterium]